MFYQYPTIRFAASRLPCGIGVLLSVVAVSAWAGPEQTDTTASTAASKFDLICTTTLDQVSGTLADGSPVVPAEIGEKRRYVFDLDAMQFTSGGRVSPIHGIEGMTVIKADPEEIRSFGGVVHMQSEWRLDLETGVSIRKNRFFSDDTGATVTGRSEWHQQCERAPYSGDPRR